MTKTILTESISKPEKSLPKGWQWARLGEVITEALPGFATGQRDPKGIIQLRMNNVDTRGRLNWDEFIRVPIERRIVLGKEILADSTPLPFAAECYRWFRPSKNEKNLFTQEELDELGRLLATRVSAADGIKPLFESFGDDSPKLYYLWQTFGSREEISKSLEDRFLSDPKNALKFISLFAPTAWSAGSGVPHKSKIEREQYDQIVRFVDSEKVCESLCRIYNPLELQSEDFPYGDEGEDQNKVWAKQFIWLHRKVKNDSAAPKDSIT